MQFALRHDTPCWKCLFDNNARGVILSNGDAIMAFAVVREGIVPTHRPYLPGKPTHLKEAFDWALQGINQPRLLIASS